MFVFCDSDGGYSDVCLFLLRGNLSLSFSFCFRVFFAVRSSSCLCFLLRCFVLASLLRYFFFLSFIDSPPSSGSLPFPCLPGGFPFWSTPCLSGRCPILFYILEFVYVLFCLLPYFLYLFSLCCQSFSSPGVSFLFFLCRWLRSVLSSLCPLLSFITEVALPCACSGFPVSLPWSVLLPHSPGFLFRSLWCFCLGVLFFSPVGILCMGFRYPYSLADCSDVSSAPFGSFVWLGLRCLHCFSLWLFLYLCYLPHFPLCFLIWPLIAPFSFFLLFDMVLSCCCSVPTVWNCVNRCLSCSSLGPCLLGFLRFVSLFSFPLFPGICPVSSSLPVGLVPVCSGSLLFFGIGFLFSVVFPFLLFWLTQLLLLSLVLWLSLNLWGLLVL